MTQMLIRMARMLIKNGPRLQHLIAFQCILTTRTVSLVVYHKSSTSCVCLIHVYLCESSEHARIKSHEITY